MAGRHKSDGIVWGVGQLGDSLLYPLGSFFADASVGRYGLPTCAPMFF